MRSTFSAYDQAGYLIQRNLPAVVLAVNRFLANNIDQQVLILETAPTKLSTKTKVATRPCCSARPTAIS